MKSLNDSVKEYTAQLRKGHIQKAYRGIIALMSALKKQLEGKYPEFKAGTLYLGYMDMTYFAFTPDELLKRSLKVAIVYLHEQNRFEVWLSGVNRKIQAEYIEIFRHTNIGDSRLSQAAPGVDSIVELEIISNPDFDEPEYLMKTIENKSIEFAKSILSTLDSQERTP